MYFGSVWSESWADERRTSVMFVTLLLMCCRKLGCVRVLFVKIECVPLNFTHHVPISYTWGAESLLVLQKVRLRKLLLSAKLLTCWCAAGTWLACMACMQEAAGAGGLVWWAAVAMCKVAWHLTDQAVVHCDSVLPWI